MPERFTKEYITLQYHPGTQVTADSLREIVRLLEGFLQRLEQRVETVQDAVTALERRVAALE